MDKYKYDVVIVGGGPAGLSCGQYCARAGLNTVILEPEAVGGQAANISRVENYPGVIPAPGYDLTGTMEQQADMFGCAIDYDKVTSIERRNKFLHIFTDSAEYRAYVVVLATGVVHRALGVEGEERLRGHGVSYCATCDGPFFKDKKIFVIGGGDSACQEATYLTLMSSDVTIVHRRDEFRAQEAIVNKMLQAGVKTKMNAVVREIVGKDKVEGIVLAPDYDSDLCVQCDCDGVFIFAGMKPRDEIEFYNRNIDVPDFEGIYQNMTLKKTNQGFYITNERMMTSEPGIFAIGDARDTPFRQIVTACSDGAIAAHYAYEYITSVR